jgi:hypothetical protein
LLETKTNQERVLQDWRTDGTDPNCAEVGDVVSTRNASWLTDKNSVWNLTDQTYKLVRFAAPLVK